MMISGKTTSLEYTTAGVEVEEMVCAVNGNNTNWSNTTAGGKDVEGGIGKGKEKDVNVEGGLSVTVGKFVNAPGGQHGANGN